MVRDISRFPDIIRANSCERRPCIVSSRREFVKIAGLATMYVAARGSALPAADEPALGLIFPPLNYPIPPDAKRLYPAGVRFIGDGVGLSGGMTIDGYEEAIPRLIPAAERLARQGAQVISFFGSRFCSNWAQTPTRNRRRSMHWSLSCGALRTLDL